MTVIKVATRVMNMKTFHQYKYAEGSRKAPVREHVQFSVSIKVTVIKTNFYYHDIVKTHG